jgi:hypothetical protein
MGFIWPGASEFLVKWRKVALQAGMKNRDNHHN